MAEQQELRFDAPPDDPVAVYLASGLTSLNEDQLTIVELVSGLVAGFCAEVGVMVHQPVMHTHPRDHADLEAEEVHAKDFAKVVESDAVIAIGDFASWGAGKELAWAERLRVPVLLSIGRVTLCHDSSRARRATSSWRHGGSTTTSARHGRPTSWGGAPSSKRTGASAQDVEPSGLRRSIDFALPAMRCRPTTSGRSQRSPT